MDECKRNEGIFTGILIGALLGPLLMFCLWLISPSQPPIPSRTILGQEKQHHADAKETNKDRWNNPAQNHPATIPKMDSGMDRSNRSNEGQEHENTTASDRWGTYPDWIIAAAALIALVVYWAQASHMGAANKATNAMVEQMRLEQRAWLSITAEITKLAVGWPLGVDFIIANSGRTPAMIRKVKIGHGIPLNYQLIDYNQIVSNHTSKPWQHRENTVAPLGSYNVHLENGHVITNAELVSLRPQNNGVLWLLVTVQYSDFTDGRESQVLLTYDLAANGFRQWDKYNYMK